MTEGSLEPDWIGRVDRRPKEVLVGRLTSFAHFGLDDYFIELPLGEGNVNYSEYLKALESIVYSGYITIERENGEDRAGDIKAGVGFLK